MLDHHPSRKKKKKKKKKADFFLESVHQAAFVFSFPFMYAPGGDGAVQI